MERQLGPLSLETIAGASITDLSYDALRRAIMAMNLYDDHQDLRLDERQLAEELGVSRTPVREAMARLEQEGLVRTVPRRGTFVVRKTMQEIVEIITVWAALESMAARLITLHAADAEISALRRIFATFDATGGGVGAHIDEYSDANLQFHQRLLQMAGNTVLSKTADTLLVHVAAVRRRTIREDERFKRSIIDHMQIIEALEGRRTELAESLVREHALDLARHVAEHVFYLRDETEPAVAGEQPITV